MDKSPRFSMLLFSAILGYSNKKTVPLHTVMITLLTIRKTNETQPKPSE